MFVENRFKDPKYINLEPYKEEIIEKYKSGIGADTLAKQYNCGPQKIRRVLNRWGIDTSKSPNSRSRGRGKNHPSWKGYQDIPHGFFRKAKDGAKTRNLEFNITIEQIWEIYIKQNKRCIFSDEDLKFDSFGSAYDGNISLDRKDSSKGYTKKNCQLVTKRINIAKADMTNDELIELCLKVAKNYERKQQRLVNRIYRKNRIHVRRIREQNRTPNKRFSWNRRRITKISNDGCNGTRQVGSSNMC